MTSLHDELQELMRPPCKLCAFLDSLPESEREEWDRELAQPIAVIGNKAVSTVLARRGLTISRSLVQRHRAGHVR